MSDDFNRLHAEASAAGEHFYIDPASGYRVFTEIGLKARGECCGAGCRHCPYHHASVDVGKRAARIQQPAWLTDIEPGPGTPTRVLFWSGGKDSYLTYLRIAELPGQVVLLTTFDANSRNIAHQDIPISDVAGQAAALDVPLLGVPLVSETDYVELIEGALALVPDISQLVFGDLHLEHIRGWREDAFKDLAERLDCELSFPLWQVDYELLMKDAERAPASFFISAVTHNKLIGLVGTEYNRAFAESLPADIDRFGENGEFHTRVTFT